MDENLLSLSLFLRLHMMALNFIYFYFYFFLHLFSFPPSSLLLLTGSRCPWMGWIGGPICPWSFVTKSLAAQIRNDWAPPIVCIGGIGRRARPDGLNRKTWSQWARVLLNGCARSFLVDPLSQSSLSIPDSSTKKGGGGIAGNGSLDRNSSTSRRSF